MLSQNRISISLVIGLATGLAVQIPAYTHAAADGANPPAVPATRPRNMVDIAGELPPWNSQMTGILIGLVVAAVGWLTAWISSSKEALRLEQAKTEAERKRVEAEQKLEEERRGLEMPNIPKEGSRRCAVLLLGIGGTGKSKLIKSFFGEGQDPSPPTVYEKSEEQPSEPEYPQDTGGDGKTTRVREWNDYLPYQPGGLTLSVVDYVGQNLGTLVRYFAQQQQKPYSAARYGYINALVFLVDLRRPPKNDSEILKRTPMPDENRIRANIEAWNWQAISAIWGMVTKKRFKQIVLFINKWDLVSNHSAEMEKKVKEMYEPLLKNIAKVFPDRIIHVILANGESGDGGTRLKTILWDASDPPSEA